MTFYFGSLDRKGYRGTCIYVNREVSFKKEAVTGNIYSDFTTNKSICWNVPVSA